MFYKNKENQNNNETNNIVTNEVELSSYVEDDCLGENELKEICKIFGHGKGAASSTSITAQDILDITRYYPSVSLLHLTFN